MLTGMPSITSFAEMSGDEDAEEKILYDEDGNPIEAEATVEYSFDLDATLPQGVSINGVDLSGATCEEALAVLEDFVASYADATFTFTVDDAYITATAEEAGLCVRNDDVIERALAYGSEGNLLGRYMSQLAQENGETKDFALSLGINTSTLISYLEDNAEELVILPVDNTIKLVDGSFVFIEGETGIGIQTEESAVMVTRAIADAWDGSDLTFELYTEVVEPSTSRELLESVQDVLGSYSTNYSSSASGRKANIARAVELLDGTVLLPGESLSVDTALLSRNEANGYQLAGSYENGATVETYGGGVCQVSTTLYNAVIRAELEIVTRYPHSMVVSYVDPSMDAAIAEGLKDFVFANNTEAPIYIHAYTSNNNLYFVIYGAEYRDSNRSVVYESEILDTVDATFNYVVSTEYEIGYYGKTTSAHTGYSARLWKHVYVNGVLESSTIFNTSKYSMSAGEYSVGIAGATEEQIAALTAACAQATETQDEADVAYLEALVASYVTPQEGVVETEVTVTTTDITTDTSESSTASEAN